MSMTDEEKRYRAYFWNVNGKILELFSVVEKKEGVKF